MPNKTEQSGWIESVQMKFAFLRWSHLLVAVLLFGALLRVVHYGLGRMLWLDEAMLTVNFVSRSGAELLAPLDFRQVAPSGWLLLVDSIVDTLKNYAYGGRLPALVAGLASLWLFYKLCLTQLSKPATFIAVSVFALSFPAVYFSAEVKPYIFDMLLWLALAYGALKVIDLEQLSPKIIGIFVAIFLLGSSFTLAAPIVIGAIGGGLILNRYLKGDLRAAIALALGAAVAAAIFLFLSLTIYKTQVDVSGISDGRMGSYFARLYAPFPPTSASDILWYPSTSEDLLTDLFGGHSASAAGFLAICGAVVAVRKRIWLAAFCLAPIALAVLLSMVQIYPMLPRLMLYAVPIVILLAALALDRLMDDANRFVPAIVTGAVLFLSAGSVSNFNQESTFTPHDSYRDLSAELATLAENSSEQDVILLTRWSLPTYLLYRHQYGLEQRHWAIVERPLCLTDASIEHLGAKKIWLMKPFGSWARLDEHLEIAPTSKADQTITYSADRLIDAMDWMRRNKLEGTRSSPVDCTTVREVDPYLDGGTSPIQLGEFFAQTQQ